MSIPGSASPLFLATAAAAAPAGYQIDRSLRFNDDDSPSCSRSFSSAGNRKKWTWSGWFKIGNPSQPGRFFGGGTGATSRTNIFYYPRTNNLGIGFFSHVGGSIVGQAGSTAVLADHSAWYHLVFAFDAANSTVADRLKIYINGVEQSISYSVNVSNIDHHINNNIAHYVGRGADGYSFDGYLAEVHFVDGQALAPTDFGETNSNNNWDPIAYSGSYGSNGFYLKFADNSSSAALGTDSSGNSNTFAINNISVAASTNATPGTFSGKDGISFNGTDAEVTLSSDADLNPGNGLFTLECYAYAASGGNAEFGIYDGSPGGAGSLVIRRVGSGTLMVERHNQAFDITGAAFSENTWHHVAVTRDSSNNVRLFVDGNQSGSTSTNNTQNYQGLFRLGRTNNAFTNGYISNLRLIKGTCLYTGNFTAPTGNLSNVTNTKLLMAQSTTSATAATVKPSGVTISAAGDNGVGIDSLLDTPTNYTPGSGNAAGNYATISGVDNAGVTLSNGNLEMSTSGWQSFKATIGVTSGKYYWETQNKQTAAAILGVATQQASVWPSGSIFGSSGHGGGDSNPAWTWAGQYSYFNGTSTYTGQSNHAATDVIMYALDLDNGKLWFGKNGTWFNSSWGTNGNPATGANPTVSGLNTSYRYFPAGTTHSGGAIYNFGQRPFAYTPPTGFVSLCTQNLDETAYASIPDGSTAFDITLHNNSSQTSGSFTTTITPDLIIMKRRDSTSNWVLQDILRGYGDYKNLHPNLNLGETSTENITSVSNTTVNYGTNTNMFNTQVAYYWDVGTSSVSNTDGNITSTVRASQANGISLVAFTGNGTSGSTVGHGLNAAPKLVLLKNRDTDSTNFRIYNTMMQDGNLDFIYLNEAQAKSDSSLTAPTNSVFTVGSSNDTNQSTKNMLAICFSPVEGYSAFGSYIGNGSSSSGTFCYCGFRPRFVMIKNTTSNVNTGGMWVVIDTARDPGNNCPNYLQMNANSQEGVTTVMDILSNGFRVTNAYTSTNANGFEYLFIAFAEHPFRTARAR